MPIIQIIAKEKVRYSLNNGLVLTEFDPGEHYSVPDYVANGMVVRKWAQVVELQPKEVAPPAPPATPSADAPAQPDRPPRRQRRTTT